MKNLAVPLLGVAIVAAAVLVLGRPFAWPMPGAVAAPLPATVLKSSSPMLSDRVAAKRPSRPPVAFVPNLGQWQSPAAYVARFGAMTVFLERAGWSFTILEPHVTRMRERNESVADDRSRRGVGVRMHFAGGMPAELIAERLLPGKHNYFLGNDPATWRSDVPLYGSVRYRGLHPGVDVRAREQDGHFEFDLLLQPDANLAVVEMIVEGVERLQIDADGALVMTTELGPVRMPAPVSWEEGPRGERQPVLCTYVLRGEDRFGVTVADRRPGWALVVDPGLVWSTFLGGAGDEDCRAMALDGQGNVVVAGSTDSATYPVTPGAFNGAYQGPSIDACVTCLAADGTTLVYSTFLGGSTGNEIVNDLALDSQGAVTVTGATFSTDFPTTAGAFAASSHGQTDAFVTRIAVGGSSLVFSTYLGGSAVDLAYAVAVDSQGAVTVAGNTRSANFPTTLGAFDTSWTFGNSDAFVTRIASTGSALLFSTYMGGGDRDAVTDLAVDAQGRTTVVGGTFSADFPTTLGAFDTTYNGGISYGDAFCARLSSTGSSLVFSTYLGGSGDEGATALAVDPQGAVTVGGYTQSSNFPVSAGAFDTTFNGGAEDAFVARLPASGASLIWSTYLGGVDGEGASSVALDPRGQVTIVGYTRSFDFPTTAGAHDTSYNGPNGLDGFVTRIAASGDRVVYSTFLGGASNDVPLAVAVDGAGAATLAGNTLSANFPTTSGCYDAVHDGFNDAFVTRLDMLPTGVAMFGASSPGCNGPLAMSVTSMPRVGNATFALTCGSAAPNAVGLIAFAAAGLPAPLSVLGVDIWLDAMQLLVTATVTSNAIGACDVPLPIPNVPAVAGVQLFTQFLWLGPNAAPPCPPLGFSASNALAMTIQP